MRLIGSIDGVEVNFDFYPPNQFKAEIPKKLDGVYVVELKALDDAGNETNYSNIFIKIDFQKMSFSVVDGFEYNSNNCEYNSKEETGEYFTKEMCNFNSMEINTDIYSFNLIEGYFYKELEVEF